MTLSYPTWWKGGRWDVERLMNDLFTFADNPAADGLVGVRVEPFLVENSDREAWLGQGNGYLLIHRNGGRLDKTKAPWVDEALVTVGALTKSRDASNELMSYAAAVFAEFEEGGVVYRSTAHLSGISTTFMQVPGEVVGPQLNPGQYRDDRFVPSVWQIHANWPRGLDYRGALGLDH